MLGLDALEGLMSKEPGIGILSLGRDCLTFGSIPHPVMGTTRNNCRYRQALLAPYLGAIYCRELT